MGICKAHSFASHSIEIRRGNFGIAIVATEIAITEVISQDKKNIGKRCGVSIVLGSHFLCAHRF